LTTNTHGFVPFVGVRYIDPSGFFAQAQMAFPVGFSHIDITPVTGSFTIGVALGDTPEPAPEPEPEPIVLPAAPASPPPAAAPIIVVPVYEPEKHESATPVPAPAPAPDAP
jgi:hypothetical protein